MVEAFCEAGKTWKEEETDKSVFHLSLRCLLDVQEEILDRQKDK